MTGNPAKPYVLALRFRQFGDVLATLDALKALKEAEPEGKIAYVVDSHYHDLLRGEPYLDLLLGSPPSGGGVGGLMKFIRYARKLRSLGASVCLDFHSNPRSAFLSVLSGAKKRVGFDVRIRKMAYTTVVPRAEFEYGRIKRRHSAASALAVVKRANPGVRSQATLAALTITPEAAGRGRELLELAGVPAHALDAGEVVGVNPGNPYPAKAWPRENFAELAGELDARGKKVVMLWGPGERDEAERIRAMAGGVVIISPEVTLSELPGFIKHFGLIVTIDSGLKHLAVCARVPTVTVFGPTSPEEWHIGTERDRYLWKGLSCSPCRRRECPFGAPCMGGIRVKEVLREISAIESAGAE